MNICNIPISIGELYDKLSILQIKKEKIKNNDKLYFINKEIEYLQPYINKFNLELTIVKQLKNINEKLWDIEDKIRIKENASTQYDTLDGSQTISKFAPSIGFGLEYAFNEKITGRAQYKRSFLKANLDQEKTIFLTKIKDVDTFNIGLAYNF